MDSELPEIRYVLRFFNANADVVDEDDPGAEEANVSNENGVFFEAARFEGMWWWSISDLYPFPVDGSPCADGHATVHDLVDAAGEHCGARFVHDDAD